MATHDSLLLVLAGWRWAARGAGPRPGALRPRGRRGHGKGPGRAIARSEKSVVAIARVRKEQPDETFRFESRPDPFGRRLTWPRPPQPTDPGFVPNEYGTGVVVDRRGLILTAYHVLGEESDYYVTTSERKVYRAWVKAADPRSDLAVLSIDAAGLTPITLGDAAALRKGQIVVTLGNPYAIARDGQASAGWGIVANLARKAPPSPEDSDTVGAADACTTSAR